MGYVTGVIPRSKITTFERVLWRILRGNLFMNFAEIDEPVIDPTDSDKTVTKNVFAIFAHGHQVINKIKKISESMGGTLYSIDESSTKRSDALVQVSKRIKDLDIVSDSIILLYCFSCCLSRYWHKQKLRVHKS